MKIKYGVLALAFIVVCVPLGLSEEGKPNFSGTWILDKEKSDLGSQGQGGGGGRGSGRGGIFGRGIPGLGGGHSGGGSGRTGGGMGGTGMGGVAPASLVIEHEEPNLTIKKTMNAEGDERVQELRYTTDGKDTTTEGFRQGMTMKSKTTWKGNQLVTESEVETPMGTMTIKEARRLSEDGNEMTVNVSGRRGTQKLVYKKQ